MPPPSAARRQRRVLALRLNMSGSRRLTALEAQPSKLETLRVKSMLEAGAMREVLEGA